VSKRAKSIVRATEGLSCIACGASGARLVGVYQPPRGTRLFAYRTCQACAADLPKVQELVERRVGVAEARAALHVIPGGKR